MSKLKRFSELFWSEFYTDDRERFERFTSGILLWSFHNVEHLVQLHCMYMG